MEWLMTWAIIEVVLVFVYLIVPLTTGWFVGLSIILLGAIFMGRFLIFDDLYFTWKKHGNGDHPWFEWTYCREAHRDAMNNYDPATYCKIDFDSFQKYFNVNPSRYVLRPGFVVFDDRNARTEVRIVFKRRELFKYFIFRRNWCQSRQMVRLIEFVQSDIDKLRDDAQSYIDRAKAGFKTDFNIKEEEEE